MNVIRNKCTGQEILKYVGYSLVGADLRRMNLSQADFRGMDMSDVDATWADMGWADFTDANLTDTDLSFACLTRAIFTGAVLSNCNIHNTDFSASLFNKTSFNGEILYRPPVIVKTSRKDVVITPKRMTIGGLGYTHQQWRDLRVEGRRGILGSFFQDWEDGWNQILLSICDLEARK